MNEKTKYNYINNRPSFNLRECLDCYDNERLLDTADKQHLLVNMGMPIDAEDLNRNKLINKLDDRIYAHFQEDLAYLPPREINFLMELVSVDFNIRDNLDYNDCKFLHALGYIYLFNYNNKVYPVIPRELKEIYNLIPKEQLSKDLNLSKELYSYAIALIQIHGIYTIEYFMDVWNKHNANNKIDFELTSTYFDMMYDRQDYFDFDYMYIVTNYPSNDYGYQLLDNRDKTYHIPSKEDIYKYSKYKFSDAPPYLNHALPQKQEVR